MITYKVTDNVRRTDMELFKPTPEFVVSHRKRIRTLVIFGVATLFLGLLNLSEDGELFTIQFILYSAVFAFEITILLAQLSKKPNYLSSLIIRCRSVIVFINRRILNPSLLRKPLVLLSQLNPRDAELYLS